MGGRNLMNQNCDDSYLLVVDNSKNVSKKFCTKNDYGEYTGWSGDLMLSLFSGIKSKSTNAGFHMRYETDKVRNLTLSDPRTCKSGERFSTRYNKCKLKKCKCRHGVPAIGEDCPRHRFHKCTQCREFFKLDSHGHCMGCEAGKHFSKKGGCVKNKCKCRNGEAKSEDCPKHRFRYCQKCNPGYKIVKKGTRKYCRLIKRPPPPLPPVKTVGVITPTVGFISPEQNEEVVCDQGFKFRHRCLKLTKALDIKRYLCIRKQRKGAACKKKLGAYSEYFGDMKTLTEMESGDNDIFDRLYAIGTTCKSGQEPYVICQCKGPGDYRYFIEESSKYEAKCRRQ